MSRWMLVVSSALVGLGVGFLGAYAVFNGSRVHPGDYNVLQFGDALSYLYLADGRERSSAQSIDAIALRVANSLVLATTSARTIKDDANLERLDRYVRRVKESGALERVKEQDARVQAARAAHCWIERNGSLRVFEVCFQAEQNRTAEL